MRERARKPTPKPALKTALTRKYAINMMCVRSRIGGDAELRLAHPSPALEARAQRC
jgi:hypothetical protein